MKKWAHTFPSGLPFWELEFWGIPKFSKSDLRGQNSLNWRFIYTSGNLLKHKYLKWVHMIHLNTYNTSYGKKTTSYVHAKGVPHIIGKLLMKAITVPWISPQSEVYKKYRCPKWRKPQFREFWDSWFRSPRKNDIWVQAMASHKKYYKREGDGFPQVQAMVNFVNPFMFVVCSCTKSALTMH